ncbi:MAG: endonuclease/exonuclease/phosphatase family protein [Chloroflexi bacterium]|nr:endonuclease/exonuclease/phosphatase family protein [Chloroflexota bacterium]
MVSLTLLTFNCFGAPGFSTRHRLRRLAEELNRAAYDIVCLQEVQTHRYRRLFADQCRSAYPHQAYQPFIHAPMGGLLTLARQPLEATQFTLYRERGLWYTPAVTDWILHKGILATRWQAEDVPVVILNTHLTANYTGDWSRNNPFARQEQGELMQLAEAVQAQPTAALVIACGDFNVPRGSWLYESFLAATGMTDPLAGDTRPTFRPHRGMGARYAAPIDFTFVRVPAGRVFTLDSELRYQDRVHGSRPRHLSDHNAVELRVKWESVK